MTISGPAVPVFCMYLVAAERQGVDISALNGTLQTDIFKEYIAQKEWLFAPEPHLRLIGDLMEYCAAQHPATTSRSRCPATTSARRARRPRRSSRSRSPTGSATSSWACPAASTSTSSRPGCRFFFDAHVDFFEEIAKFRAARRIWARWLRDVYGATTEKAQWLRFHTQTAGRVADRAAAAATTSCAPPSRRSPRCSAARTRCTPTPSTRRSRCRPSRPPRSRCAPSRCSWRRPASSTSPTRSAARWYVEALTDRIEAEAEAHLRQDPRARRARPAAPVRRRGRAPDRPDDLRHPARHRGRLVHVRDRRRRLPLPAGARAGRQEGRRRQLPHRLGQPRAGDPAGQPRGRARAGARSWPSARPAATTAAVERGARAHGRGRRGRART